MIDARLVAGSRSRILNRVRSTTGRTKCRARRPEDRNDKNTREPRMVLIPRWLSTWGAGESGEPRPIPARTPDLPS